LAINPIRGFVSFFMKIRSELAGNLPSKFVKLLAFLLLSNTAVAVSTNLVFTTQPASTTVGAPLAHVVVQVQTATGTGIPTAGVTISLALGKGTGLGGITNSATDATGKAVFTNLAVSQYGLGDTLVASSSKAKAATSSVFNITQGRTTNVLALSVNPAVYGGLVTVTSTISVVAPSVGKPTGMVTFKDGTTVLGTSALVSLSAVFTTTNRLLAGNHSISATYSGDTNFGASSASATLTVSKLALTVSGITASNKVYNASTAATLNTSIAVLNGVLSGDNVVLGTTGALGTFSDKNAGTNKTVSVSGLTISGTNVANYSLTQPAATATITVAGLTVTAKGVSKVYDGTTAATATLSDNRFSGDLLVDSYVSALFTNRNIGTGKPVAVSGIFISGTNAANYVLVNTNAATTANITAAPLTVSGVTASNKVYDAKTAAILNFSAAVLSGAVGGDILSLVTTNAKGVFPNKNVGANMAVTISGLTVSGTNTSNYSLAQPATTASISSASLTVAAKGVNKVYDGTTAATVTMSDNRFAGDSLADTYVSAVFANSAVGTNQSIVVTGIAVAGTDSGNYSLQNTNATTAAGITAAGLLVAADNLSRPFGTTNPPLTYIITGFVNGETAAAATAGAPVLSTPAKLTSVVSNYPIVISKGTLAAVNYVFAFTNGVLAVTPAPTVSLVVSGLNPARTNQNIMFTTAVSSSNAVAVLPTGLVRFKCNGTNLMSSPLNVTNGLTTVLVPAASLGTASSVTVTAEFSDPSGNFASSTNSLAQTIVVAPPVISNVSIAAPSMSLNGSMQATFTGTPGATFVLLASSDLINWAPVCTNIADTNGVATLVESNAIAYPSRYYRGMIPQ
jgi:hypothetical protein